MKALLLLALLGQWMDEGGDYGLIEVCGPGGCTIVGTFVWNDDIKACWGTSSDVCLEYDTAQTNDAACLGLSTDSETLHLAQTADCSTNWGLADQGTPTLVIHNSDQTQTTYYMLLQHDGTNGVITIGAGGLAINASDPADSGVIRLDNAESICWEASPTGTDECLTVSTSETLQYTGSFYALGGAYYSVVSSGGQIYLQDNTGTGDADGAGNIYFQADDDASNLHDMARIEMDVTAATSDSEEADLVFYYTTPAAGASVEALRLDGSASTVTVGNDLDVTNDLQVTGQTYEDSLNTETPTGTTETIDWDTGNVQKLDLESATGNVTVTLSNPNTTARYELIIQQDGGGGARNVVWPATVKWANGSTPTISTGNDEVDWVTCLYDGTNYLCTITQDHS